MTPDRSSENSLPQPSSEPLAPEPRPAARSRRSPLRGRGDALRALPIAEARPPTAMTCLQCQLLGHRKLTCSKAELCAELPQSFAIGPLLLAAWLATAIAFVVAVYGR